MAETAAEVTERADRSSTLLLLPPLSIFPERRENRYHWLDKFESAAGNGLRKILGPFASTRRRRIVRATMAQADRLAALTDQGLADETRNLRHVLRRNGIRDKTTPTAFALIREHAKRTLGLYHHRVQLLGGLVILDGGLAEMETGEGKTLTATLAAATAAMAGVPVHIVTVNDYLAERDAENLGRLFERLGLTVATIRHGMHPEERRQAYAADIVYASNSEIAFDYLRDRIKLSGHPTNTQLKVRRFQRRTGPEVGLVMRGLHFAIIDEADSVLVDEARTPLIISRETDAAAEAEWAAQAHRLADDLQEDVHFRLIRSERRIQLTEAGRTLLEERGVEIGGIWENRIRREEAVSKALSAQRLFTNGDHYLIRDGKVVIVDENTGRVMDERSWSDGLHQLVEFKEGVEVTSRKDAIARMTYQRFFRRYQRLAGMTGTAREVRSELWAVYRLAVSSIPTNAPSRKRTYPKYVFPTQEAKWQAITQRARDLCSSGRPVLIGTRSVMASETISEHLTAANLQHNVLNANDDGQEAEIIAAAGTAGRLTVATNMAGRGVDIVLEPSVVETGGLHVVLSERHDSKRIDRQLEGRTARRGEPGSTETLISLEDPLLDVVKATFLKRLARSRSPLGRIAAAVLFYLAQRQAERSHSHARRILLDQDRRLGTMLAFTGKPE